MHKFSNNQSLVTFNDLIKKPNHSYSANFSDNIFCSKMYSLNSSKYSISVGGLKACNKFLQKGR